MYTRTYLHRIVSSGMLHRVALVRTDVSEELITSFIRLTRIGELGTTLALTNNRRTLPRWLLVTACVVPSSPILVTLMKEALSSSETSVLTRATRHNNPEDTILHSHRRENLKSYILICPLHTGSVGIGNMFDVYPVTLRDFSSSFQPPPPPPILGQVISHLPCDTHCTHCNC
jgi:hypothetical protein